MKENRLYDKVFVTKYHEETTVKTGFNPDNTSNSLF